MRGCAILLRTVRVSTLLGIARRGCRVCGRLSSVGLLLIASIAWLLSIRKSSWLCVRRIGRLHGAIGTRTVTTSQSTVAQIGT